MRFYLTFGVLGSKVVNKRTMNLFKGSEYFQFSNFTWLNQKYKPALSKSDFAWFNSYFMRLVIVPLAANIGNLQPLISCADIFFLYDFYNVIIHNDFYSDLLLCNFRFFKDVEINGRKLFR